MTSPKPKILLLAHEALYGGGTRQTFHIMEELVKQGYPTVLVSNAEKTWLGQTIESSHLQVKTYYTSLIAREIRPLQEIKLFVYLIQVILKEKPDILFASGVKLIGLAGVVGWLCRVPKRVAIIRGEGAPPGSRMLKVIYLMERFLSHLGCKYITVSEYIRQQMLSHKLCRSEQVSSVHDGIDHEKIQHDMNLDKDGLVSRYHLPDDAIKIGMVGRLVAGKRYECFIEIMGQLCNEFPNVYGFLIGEGEKKDSLKKQIQDLDLENRLYITGYCQNMALIYGDLDISILLTDYEGCPNAILESFAAKIPVIASDVCGIGEMVFNHQNGFLVRNDDSASIYSALKALITDKELRFRFGQSGYEVVTGKFDLKMQVKNLIETLLSL